MARSLRTAVHEAGHSVTMIRRGHVPRCAVVAHEGEATAEGYQGVVRWGTREGRIDAMDRMTVSVAGPIATLMHDPAADPGWSGDIPHVLERARTLESSARAVNEACIRARKILEKDWSAVMATAHELVATGNVSGERVKEIIRETAAGSAVKPLAGQSQQPAAGTKPDSAGRLLIEGTCTKLNQATNDAAMRGFAIRFTTDCFDEFLRAQPDVFLQSFHNDELPAARSKNGTLSLWRTGNDIKFGAEILDVADGRSLFEKIRTGVLDEVSIGLTFDHEADAEWSVTSDDVPLLTVRKGGFSEVSIVRHGAISNTSVRTLRPGEGLKHHSQPGIVLTGRVSAVQHNQEHLAALAAGFSNALEYRRKNELDALQREGELIRLGAIPSDEQRREQQIAEMMVDIALERERSTRTKRNYRC